MSNHPIPPVTPYWAAPWASHPSSSGSIPHNIPFNQNTSSAQQQFPTNGGPPYDYKNLDSFYANASLPGLGGRGPAGSIPPPPFAFPAAFPPAQIPHPPFPAQIPNIGYPLMPLRPATSHLSPSRPSTSDLAPSAPSNAPDSRPMTTTSSGQDLDREEGELTDMEGPPTTQSTSQRPQPESRVGRPDGDTFGGRESHKVHSVRDYRRQTDPSQFKGAGYHSAVALGNGPELVPSDLEEGEASPEPRNSDRDSGSPYDPPMPMDTGSPATSKSRRETSHEPERHDGNTLDANIPRSDSNIVQPTPASGKPLAQLRVQAQGALLSLAPHSIRYAELVGEGVNPAILRQLYEEVGIKVPATPSPVHALGVSSDERILSETGLSAADEQERQPTKLPEPGKNAAAAQKPTSTDAGVIPSQTTQSNTAKPMERKEVIARMLAAKAAKNSRASAPPQTDGTQTAPSPESLLDKSETSTPLQDGLSREKEVRVKEKNKAQTELARQRIEQLKKQGLMRSQQKSQLDTQVVDKEQRSTTQELEQGSNSTVFQHPLPERPPDPESAAPARIPGLFMTEGVQEAANGASVTPVQGAVVDSVAHPRGSQRKRPRASDFDEPIPVPKRTFSNGTNNAPPERLVIDISDDEFYGDDEDGRMRAETTPKKPSQGSGISVSEGLLRTFPPSIESLPHRPATSQSQGFSASSTPQTSRNSEQEDLRKKDLEIQAMHRRIAELEQRKKARLASRTQSPRTSDLSATSSSEPVNLPSASEPTALEITGKNAEDILASLDSESLRKLKSKLLRKQEIEAGIPSLDAEIQRSDLKLVDLRREEEKLSLEITRGKEGRRQLLEELNKLKSELNMLSLDDVNAALSRSEQKRELPVEVVEVPASERATSDEGAITVPEASQVEWDAREVSPPVQKPMSSVQESQSAAPQPDLPNTASRATVESAPDQELSDTSMSDDGSSAMDESSDSSSSSSDSSDEEMPDAQLPGTASGAPESEGERENTGSVEPSELHAENVQEPLSGHPHPDTQPQSDMVSSAHGSPVGTTGIPASRESSVSDAYEPPEPEESASPADSSYSPSLTPGSPGAVAAMEVSKPPEGQSQEAGEPLTGEVQELDFQQPSQYPQIGILDNTRYPEDSRRKFSPYTSPLKLFKAYRYHPNYTDNVSGGYRSLTYSHNIDPLKYVCPFEAAGGVCNDRSCEFQHFRDMALSDDKVLVQMGSLREGKTPEESDKYIAGLKEIINEMRRDKVKDFHTVAAEIAAYRRRFLQDPTRVLAL